MRIAAGTVIAGKYRLESQLARGGMGAVWIARHVKLGTALAVKFLDPRLATSPSFVARFEREARAAASIQSPNIVHVQDFGVDDGTPYLVMELLRGEDLRQRLRRVERLSMREAARLLVQVGKALKRAHDAGIVHRDLKPGNLFLARVDDEEILKVLDFGIAKEADNPLEDGTRTGEIIGSPHYVSPEQARAEKDVDVRSDVWAVGVITFRMVTGQLPFPGEGLGSVLSKVLVDTPPKVGEVVPGLPASLDRFFARALAKKRDERFQTVRELVDAFIAIANAEGEDDAIPPPSWSTITRLSTSVRPPPRTPAGGGGGGGSAGAGAGAGAGGAGAISNGTGSPPPGPPSGGEGGLARTDDRAALHGVEEKALLRRAALVVAATVLVVVALAVGLSLRGGGERPERGAAPAVSTPIDAPSAAAPERPPAPPVTAASGTAALPTAVPVNPSPSVSAAPPAAGSGARRKWGF